MDDNASVSVRTSSGSKLVFADKEGLKRYVRASMEKAKRSSGRDDSDSIRDLRSIARQPSMDPPSSVSTPRSSSRLRNKLSKAKEMTRYRSPRAAPPTPESPVATKSIRTSATEQVDMTPAQVHDFVRQKMAEAKSIHAQPTPKKYVRPMDESSPLGTNSHFLWSSVDEASSLEELEAVGGAEIPPTTVEYQSFAVATKPIPPELPKLDSQSNPNPSSLQKSPEVPSIDTTFVTLVTSPKASPRLASAQRKLTPSHSRNLSDIPETSENSDTGNSVGGELPQVKVTVSSPEAEAAEVEASSQQSFAHSAAAFFEDFFHPSLAVSTPRRRKQRPASTRHQPAEPLAKPDAVPTETQSRVVAELCLSPRGQSISSESVPTSVPLAIPSPPTPQEEPPAIERVPSKRIAAVRSQEDLEVMMEDNDGIETTKEDTPEENITNLVDQESLPSQQDSSIVKANKEFVTPILANNSINVRSFSDESVTSAEHVLPRRRLSDRLKEAKKIEKMRRVPSAPIPLHEDHAAYEGTSTFDENTADESDKRRDRLRKAKKNASSRRRHGRKLLLPQTKKEDAKLFKAIEDRKNGKITAEELDRIIAGGPATSRSSRRKSKVHGQRTQPPEDAGIFYDSTLCTDFSNMFSIEGIYVCDDADPMSPCRRQTVTSSSDEVSDFGDEVLVQSFTSYSEDSEDLSTILGASSSSSDDHGYRAGWWH